METPQSSSRRTERCQPDPRRESRTHRRRREVEEADAEIQQRRLEQFTSADLDSDAIRRGLAGLHPMLEQAYFIETAETSDFYDIVYDHALARKSGLYVLGEYRVGKTTSIRNAMERLANDMPWLAVLFHSAERKPSQSKKGHFGDMLKSFRYPGSTLQDPEELLPRFIMAESVQAGSKTCLLFVDEAQMHTVSQMRHLLELWNELRRENFVIVTVLVGQDGPAGLESLKTLTSEEDHGAVVARFFVKPYRLGGIHSLEDLKAYLRAYDGKLFYPPDSPWSYSRFFCKKAFDAGWRLESEAERFWDALINHTGAQGTMLARAGFRLAFVNDSIHTLLLDSMRLDKKGFKGTAKQWTEAVSSAADSELFIGRERRSS